MREYRHTQFWWSEHPGVRALIVIAPAGGSFILRRGWNTDDKVALLGVIE